MALRITTPVQYIIIPISRYLRLRSIICCISYEYVSSYYLLTDSGLVIGCACGACSDQDREKAGPWPQPHWRPSILLRWFAFALVHKGIVSLVRCLSSYAFELTCYQFLIIPNLQASSVLQSHRNDVLMPGASIRGILQRRRATGDPVQLLQLQFYLTSTFFYVELLPRVFRRKSESNSCGHWVALT